MPRRPEGRPNNRDCFEAIIETAETYFLPRLLRLHHPVIPREASAGRCYSIPLMPRATWTWTFDLPPGELWPVLADTNRFNEAMGLPPYVLEETPQPNGTVLRRGKGKAAGFTLEWEEKPYEWIEGRHFRQAREFTKGPFRRFGPVFDLEPDGKGGSRVSYALEYEPLTLTGRLFGARLAKQAGGVVEKRILEAVAFAKGERPTWFDIAPPELPEGARERAAALAAEVDRSPYGNGLGRQLADLVLTGMATDLAHLKPKKLALDLKVPQRAAIEACLAGTRAGLLDHEMGPAVHQLPRRQAHGLGALRAAARRALPVLQHRLRPRLREERRTLLRARAGGAAAGCRRLLPLGPDGHAACRRAAPAGAGREEERGARPAGRLLSPAHAASRRLRRRRASRRRVPRPARHGQGRRGAAARPEPARSPSPTTRASSWRR